MPGHSIRVFEALSAKGVPCQMYLHQGGHGGPPPLKIMNRWFTHYLHGIENGVENDPQLYVVREGQNRNSPTQYKTFPNPEAETVKFHLSPGGPAIGGLSNQPSNSATTESLIDDAQINGSTLAEAKQSPHRLIYATPKLAQDVHISGTPKVTIKLACDKPAANLSVWLVSLPWDRPKSRKRVKLTDNLITRGWADRDFTLWPEAGTKLTVDLDGTSLELPIVGGTSKLNFNQ